MMLFLRPVSTLLVSLGICFLFASILASMKTKRCVPWDLRNRWHGMTVLLFFFLAGYVAFVGLEIAGTAFPIESITSTIFLGGSVFVFLVIGLSRRTINSLNSAQKELREAHDRLEERVRERTAELAEANSALKKEITERRRAQEEIKKSHAELDQIFNTAADAMRVINNKFEIIRVNDMFTRMSGVNRDELIGKKCYGVFFGPLCHTDNCPLVRIQSGEERIEVEIEKTNRAGEVIPCIETVTPFRGYDGALLGIIEDFKDISERKAAEERLKILSVTDELTGLLNRRGFLLMAEKQIKVAERFQGELYLLYADLDGLKSINDSMGHETGDSAIKDVADILNRTFRQSDVIGRLGGDEFAVLLTGAPSDRDGHPGIGRLHENLKKANALNKPYPLSLSTGLVRHDPEKHPSIDALMNEADRLMYENKRKNKSFRSVPPYIN